MKKMAWVTGTLVFVMTLLAALGAVCTAVNNIATDETFYSAQSRAAVKIAGGYASEDEVSAYIGMDEAGQQAFAAQTVSFMKGETVAQPESLNEKESQHMLDVRTIIASLARMSKAYLAIAAALAVAAAWTGARLQSRMKPMGVGFLAAVSLVMLVVKNVIDEIAGGGFEQLFVQMHEVLFTNDLWLLDPATDILIRMMPTQLFEQAALNGASMALRILILVLVMLFAVLVIVGNMIRRHMAKGEKA